MCSDSVDSFFPKLEIADSNPGAAPTVESESRMTCGFLGVALNLRPLPPSLLPEAHAGHPPGDKPIRQQEDARLPYIGHSYKYLTSSQNLGCLDPHFERPRRDNRCRSALLPWILRLLSLGARMQLNRIAFAITSLALPFGCICEEPLARLAPVIAIGDPFDPAFSVCTKGLASKPEDRFRDCAFDFGDVDVGRARVFSFTIRNPSPVNLFIESITTEEGSDPAFTVDGEVPTEVKSAIGRLGEVVSIKFQPTVEGPVSARLILKSDAENLDEGEDVVIVLSANGVSRCKPVIEVVPAACNFGDVGVGAIGFCDLSINNIGECELIVDDIGFTPDTNQAVFLAPTFLIPTTIAGGTGVSLRLSAQPQDTSLVTGALFIHSFDPDNPRVEVPLSVQGANAPTCVARVSKINNLATTDPSPAVEPLDDVEFSSDQSSASRTGGTIVSSAWSVIAQPPESNATLANATGVTTRFHFSSSAGNVNGIDAAGTFTVGLIITDDLGVVSTQCSVTVNAIPRAGLHVQMTWDVAVNDIDLHVARNGTNWCSNDDCYYGGRTRNWGGGDSDPSLDIDDLSGFGPENVNIEAPVDGDYTIGVGMYSHSADATVTVRIFIGGQLEFEGFQTMREGETWLPARVEQRSGISTLVELNDTSDQPGTCWGGF